MKKKMAGGIPKTSNTWTTRGAHVHQILGKKKHMKKED
jgi:hypothetical protein